MRKRICRRVTRWKQTFIITRALFFSRVRPLEFLCHFSFFLLLFFFSFFEIMKNARMTLYNGLNKQSPSAPGISGIYSADSAPRGKILLGEQRENREKSLFMGRSSTSSSLRGKVAARSSVYKKVRIVPKYFGLQSAVPKRFNVRPISPWR